MIWHDREVKTYGEIFAAVAEIAALPDGPAQEQAQEFVAVYTDYLRDNAANAKVAADPRGVALSNIGYLSGYAGREEMDRIRSVFDAAHPIFGRTPAADLTPKIAFEAGVAWGSR